MVTWPFVPIGIFVWGDGMVLGALLFLASVWLWFKNDSVCTGLFFSFYVVLRTFFEIVYNMSAQFSTFRRPWEAFLPQLAVQMHLPVIDLFVFAQITYTAVCIVGMMFFIFYLKKYFAR
ncbi:MAG: hypothetical protein P4L62_00705 [Candidatus Pacebacteria bacterium]|nr:hypothetical protein [Candidatus Paceibacterota bacterium]MDR3582869.1 hypothetical protein [Candidatus Paceibacterota bacterium]